MDDRQELMLRAPYGRHSSRLAAVDRGEEAPQQRFLAEPYDGQTYYDLPALKPGHYKWLIVDYFFVGGIAGGAQVLAAVADLWGDEDDRVLVRHGRYLALAGSIAGPLLLIADLQKKSRFFNMLRIFRRTSPMSLGSWLLAGFGTLSGLAAAGQWLEDRGQPGGRTLARLTSIPAAGAGMGICFYTASLLSATSVPLWAAVPRQLAALFSTSSLATAAAALTLCTKYTGGSDAAVKKLEKFELVTGASELAALAATHEAWHRQRAGGPLGEPPLSLAHLGAIGLGVIVPLAIHAGQLLTGRRSTKASIAAAACTLAGGFLLRTAVVFGGRSSAQRPRDYFEFTEQPQQLDGQAALHEPVQQPRRIPDAAHVT